MGVETVAIQARPAAWSAQADRHDPPAADSIGERAGDRGDEDRHRRPRQDAQTSLERRVALNDLEELRQQEDRAEHPEEHQQRGAVGEPRTCGCGRSEAAASASGARSSQRTNSSARASPPVDRRDDFGLVQPTSLPRTRPQTRPKRPTLARASPGRSSASFGPRLSRRRNAASGISDEADRHVEPEDPLPGDALDDRAADERPDRDGQAADAAPGAEDEPRRSAGTAARQDGQRQRQSRSPRPGPEAHARR